MKINKQKIKLHLRRRRKIRVRAKVFGTAKKPRLSVFRSLRHTYAQLIDDEKNKTVVSASDLEIKSKKGEKKTDLAFKIGELAAEKAVKAGIKEAVFDRSGYKYHGRIKAVAEGARKGGLVF